MPTGRSKSENNNGRRAPLLIISIVLAIITLLSGAYAFQISRMDRRIAVMEEERIVTAERLARIEEKIDGINEYIRRR